MQSTTTLCVTSALQIYTIHGYLNGDGIPLVWALLPNKTTETYVELFSALKRCATDVIREYRKHHHGPHRLRACCHQRRVASLSQRNRQRMFLSLSTGDDAKNPTGGVEGCVRGGPVSCPRVVAKSHGDDNATSIRYPTHVGTFEESTAVGRPADRR